MSNKKEIFFMEVKSWFLANKLLAEEAYADILEKYRNEKFLGRILRNCANIPKVESGDLFQLIGVPLYWNYEVEGGFYFNALGADLTTSQFEELKTKFTSLLGKPDEVFNYYGLEEPMWHCQNVYLRLYHVDTHGGGYERVDIRMAIESITDGT